MTVAENAGSISALESKVAKLSDTVQESDAIAKQLHTWYVAQNTKTATLESDLTELQGIVANLIGIVTRFWVTSRAPYTNYNVRELPGLYEKLVDTEEVTGSSSVDEEDDSSE